MIFVLNERPDYLFQKDKVAVALLLCEREGSALKVIREAGKIERPGGVKIIIHPTPTPIGDVNASFNQLLSIRVREHLHQLSMIFRPQQVEEISFDHLLKFKVIVARAEAANLDELIWVKAAGVFTE